MQKRFLFVSIRGWKMSFCGALRPEQQAAAEAMLSNETGVLAATTAFGKTVLAAWLIARRCVANRQSRLGER
jgi:superfamily II DNA or RNA helicase